MPAAAREALCTEVRNDWRDRYGLGERSQKGGGLAGPGREGVLLLARQLLGGRIVGSVSIAGRPLSSLGGRAPRGAGKVPTRPLRGGAAARTGSSSQSSSSGKGSSSHQPALPSLELALPPQ